MGRTEWGTRADRKGERLHFEKAKSEGGLGLLDRVDFALASIGVGASVYAFDSKILPKD